MDLSLSPFRIIEKKRNGEELLPEEIDFFVRGLLCGDFADYQASSLLMAIYFQGMTTQETVSLTRAMAFSGNHMEWKKIQRPLADKHSTGGVGDKVSIILAPLAAACGLAVPMMSGRGLGHTGGTADKLESIPGFSTRLDELQAQDQLQKIGILMMSQSESIAPADRILYGLRDVTATIESVPLITASILSKKVAEGAHSLLLDVKVGNGAFMQSLTQAKKLATSIVNTASQLGIRCRALLTDMNQPLGCTAGHLLEVAECISILSGKEMGPQFHFLGSKADHSAKKSSGFCSADLIELTLHSCAQMLQLSGLVKNMAEGRRLACSKLRDGSAFKIFKQLVVEQGGSLDFIENLSSWPTAPTKFLYTAKRSGFLNSIDTKEIGNLLIHLGGGRKKVGDPIDTTVGFLFCAKLGSVITKGQTLIEIHAPNEEKAQSCGEVFDRILEISSQRKMRPKLIYACIDEPKRNKRKPISAK